MLEGWLLRAAVGVAVGCDGVREHGASDMLVADLVLATASISLTYKPSFGLIVTREEQEEQ